MSIVTEQIMGRFSIEVELTNYDDLVLAKSGAIAPEQVRRTKVGGVVDSGATRLVIPQSTANQLGLEESGRVTVRYANGRTANRAIAHHIQLSFGGRESVFSAVIEPARESA